MNGVDTTLLVLAITLATAIGGRQLRTPMPVILAAVGMVFGGVWRFVPGLPPVTIPPERALLIFLPPLLTTAAYALPIGAFRRNLGPILMLAVGLVLATMTSVAAVAHAMVGIPWAAAFVLGAIVAPPDPVAASSVAGETGLSHRLVVILEGEGLINDAVAIVAYHLALMAASTGQFTWGGTGLALAREAPLGVVVGLITGWGFTAIRRRINDVTLEAGISLLSPFLTYHIADRLGGSAVLAVVTLGFILQRTEVSIATPAARLAARTVWGAVRFASTALVFLLLGLLIGELATTRLDLAVLRASLVLAAVVIGLRFAWLYTVPRMIRWIPGLARSELPSWREFTVLGWAGMRGVVSLALALALPQLPSVNGLDTRYVIVLATFVVIVTTLVIQGVTLLPLIERLGIGDPGRDTRDEQRSRQRARRAGLAAMERVSHEERLSAADCHRITRDIATGRLGVAGDEERSDRQSDEIAVALDAERRAVLALRDMGQIGESLAERLVTELDIDELQVRGEAARLTGAAD
jgi:Na+/H+ antiporter